MGIVAIFMAFLLVSIHACHARHSLGFAIHSKDVIEENTKLKQEMNTIKTVQASEKTKQTLSGHDISMITSDGSRSVIDKLQGLEKNKRSMLESKSQEAKEATGTKEDKPVEDVMVTDYVTPHRKSPIHNSELNN
ncbi:uncharacterized protein LOC141653502 isoform X1 [Silene latifolia]|uniref:uncharacterized protein LOC141653502 isoform X1 n=1 Tax=Silene latifolia TaxID=37657 RepID=UPI003D7843E7